MRIELVVTCLMVVGCSSSPQPEAPPSHARPLQAGSRAEPALTQEARAAAVQVEGVQALYGSDGRPRRDGPSVVMPLREGVTLVPTEREQHFAGLGPAHPPRVGRRNVEVRGARLDNTLRMLAEHGRFNLVLPSTLAETVTLRLHGVEPYEALLVVAQNHGLDVHYAGDVVTVVPAGTL